MRIDIIARLAGLAQQPLAVSDPGAALARARVPVVAVLKRHGDAVLDRVAQRSSQLVGGPFGERNVLVEIADPPARLRVAALPAHGGIRVVHSMKGAPLRYDAVPDERSRKSEGSDQIITHLRRAPR